MSSTGRARHIERQTRPRTPRAARNSESVETPAALRKTSDERWREILDVSARMFAANGFAGTSLQQIADELDMLKGSLYYYINSKEDLLYEVIRTVYWDGMANFKQITSGPGSAAERLQAAIAGHVRHLTGNMTATTVFLHEFNQMSAQRQRELSALDYSGWIRDLVKEGQADGSIRDDLDPALVTMSVLGATNWVYRWYREGRTTPAEIGAQYAAIFAGGLAQPTAP